MIEYMRYLSGHVEARCTRCQWVVVEDTMTAALRLGNEHREGHG